MKEAQSVKELFFEAVDRLQQRNADKDPEEVERDVAATVKEVRHERYERRRAERQRGA